MKDFNQRIEALRARIDRIDKRSGRMISVLHEEIQSIRKEQTIYLSEQSKLSVNEHRYMSAELRALWEAHDKAIVFYVKMYRGEFSVLSIAETVDGFTAKLGIYPHSMMRFTVNVDVVQRCEKVEIPT